MKLLSIVLAFLITANFSYGQDGPAVAEDVLTAAYQQASKENKNIILMFHASWCGWCRKMDASMNDASCKKLFEKNYVIVHLTVEESKDKKYLENPGAEIIKKKYHGEAAGLPFWLVLDKNGNLIGDSYIRKVGVSKNEAGDNIGCPASDKEVEAFVDILRKSSSLSEKQLDKIADRFKKNQPATTTSN